MLDDVKENLVEIFIKGLTLIMRRDPCFPSLDSAPFVEAPRGSVHFLLFHLTFVAVN